MLCAPESTAATNAPHVPPSAVDQRREDAALVARLVADEPAAWREFNTRYATRIFRSITRVTSRFAGIVTPDDVREIYATFCLQLLANDKSKLQSFDPDRGSSLASWIGLLATHAAYDFLRSQRRQPRGDELSEVEPLAAPTPSPFELCEIRQRARIVSDLLGQFTERDQRFVELYFAEGLAPERIAELMGISVKTVYTKRHKIQVKLEGLLDQRVAGA